MNCKILSGGILLIASWACSPANIKIAANPPKIGYKSHETLVIAPLSQIRDVENEQLMNWANDFIKEKLTTIQTIKYWDVHYKASQSGLPLLSFSEYDTSTFRLLNEKLKIDFVLVANIDRVRENYQNELNNPDYQRREAIVSLKLIDLKNTMVSWYCTTRVLANPFKVNGSSQEYAVNIHSGSFAVQKAYKKSVNRLVKSFVLID